ncbi:TetR/AcrR family transcriptional regulator [Streptomyces sp. NPDC057743]|uniref:TetR/AcrR family transcriptional regulator n=1 Tax=Streptomyces sp. NPDC057743 TaxID=3346236 RepID=UPI0036B93072
MFEKSSKTQAPARPGVRQRRGVERRRAILDAAEALLGEQGYQAGTLKAIGERAGIPTASVYHYFSDRHQVDAELLQRHIGELDALITTALESPELRTLRDAGDAVIDPLRNYFRQHPSCTVLWFARGNETLDAHIRAFDTSQAERLWHFLIERELLPADTPQLVVQLAWEAGNRLFDTAFRHSPTGDDATINEVRRMVTAYLETYAPKATKRRG